MAIEASGKLTDQARDVEKAASELRELLPNLEADDRNKDMIEAIRTAQASLDQYQSVAESSRRIAEKLRQIEEVTRQPLHELAQKFADVQQRVEAAAKFGNAAEAARRAVSRLKFDAAAIKRLREVQLQAEEAAKSFKSLPSLDAYRTDLLGRHGHLSALVKSVGALPPEQRREVGQAFNLLKHGVDEALTTREVELKAAALAARLASERLDVTLPVRERPDGRIHPVSQVTEEIIAIFADMGFSVAEGPDIEDDWHNFEALNMPPDHPARQMQDTFYLEAEQDGRPLVLRTHTSPVQIRTMLAQKPPLRIIAPGRTYRRDSDMTHTPMFHQVEGLVIDRAIHMGHLKGCLVDFARAFFERDDVKLRFRPSYFPFTEPSAEVDIGCRRSKDELVIGEGHDWLEILGSGMVHPKVLQAVGLDPDEWQGFAFGMGIDRVAMLKYGIPDLRTFFEADLRWLRHYGFAPLDVPTTYGGLSR